MKLNKEFWEAKYSAGHTQWDAGCITTPLKEYVDQLTNKDIRILIPGVGYGHEMAYLDALGFQNIYAIDIAEAPLERLRQRLPQLPKDRLIQGDFFQFEGAFDLILEQTFFCALDPKLRKAYVQQVARLLKEGGKLAGLLFDIPLQPEGGPPYGGDLKSYEELFKGIFQNVKISPCYNSIKPRQGNELFIQIKK